MRRLQLPLGARVGNWANGQGWNVPDMQYTRPQGISPSSTRMQNNRLQVDIFDEIGPWFFGMYGVQSFREDVGDWQGDIDLRINSPGGDYFEGLALRTLVKQHPGEVHAVNMGLIGSAATLPAVAADTLLMSDASQWMVHRPFTVAMGHADELRDVLKLLDNADADVLRIYAEATGKSEDDVRELIGRDAWLSAAEAVDWGFADGIVGQETPAVAAAVEPGVARMLSARTRLAALQAPETENTPCPLCGKSHAVPYCMPF